MKTLFFSFREKKLRRKKYPETLQRTNAGGELVGKVIDQAELKMKKTREEKQRVTKQWKNIKKRGGDSGRRNNNGQLLRFSGILGSIDRARDRRKPLILCNAIGESIVLTRSLWLEFQFSAG
jgi:hypothetical protein